MLVCALAGCDSEGRRVTLDSIVPMLPRGHEEEAFRNLARNFDMAPDDVDCMVAELAFNTSPTTTTPETSDTARVPGVGAPDLPDASGTIPRDPDIVEIMPPMLAAAADECGVVLSELSTSAD